MNTYGSPSRLFLVAATISVAVLSVFFVGMCSKPNPAPIEAPKEAPALSSEISDQKPIVTNKKAVIKKKIRKIRRAPKPVTYVRRVPAKLGPHFAKIATLTREHKWDEVIALCDVFLKTKPQHPKAWDYLLYALEQKGDNDAFSRIESIALDHPNMARAHAAYARGLAQSGRTSFALAVWHKAVELEPNNLNYKLGLAVLSDKLGHVQSAIKAYRDLPEPRAAQAQERLEYLLKVQSAEK